LVQHPLVADGPRGAAVLEAALEGCGRAERGALSGKHQLAGLAGLAGTRGLAGASGLLAE